MAQESRSAQRAVDDARAVLRTIREEEAEGRRPYISDVRRLVEGALALRYPEYIQFLEKYGFLTLDRRSNLLAVTRAGEEFASGDEARARALGADAAFHFGDRLPPPGPAPETVRGERLDHRFLRLGRIGRGGLGTVYRGQQLAVDRPVAIKVLEGLLEVFRPDQHEEVVRRVELAVREHARLVSPFIVQILDQNPNHTPPYFVMELAPGGDLRRLLSSGPLPAVAAVRYFLQVALALKVAHAEGVVHRDLKPENVLLDAQGNVKLADFGITRVVERDGARLRQAYIGYGSVGYMAPELFRPGSTPGPAVDLYALGILLYEMLTGDLPGRRSPMPSELVPGVPKDLDEIFDRMTQDSPERRYASVDEVLTAVWTSESICGLLDARQAPWFVEPPVAMPGLLVEAVSDPAPAAPLGGPGATSAPSSGASASHPTASAAAPAAAASPEAPASTVPGPAARTEDSLPRGVPAASAASEASGGQRAPTRAGNAEARPAASAVGRTTGALGSGPSGAAGPAPASAAGPAGPGAAASGPTGASASVAATANPATANPATANPGASNPATSNPGASNPAARPAGPDAASHTAEPVAIEPFHRDSTTPPPAALPPETRSHFIEVDEGDEVDPGFRPNLSGNGDPFGPVSEPPTAVAPVPRRPAPAAASSAASGGPNAGVAERPSGPGVPVARAPIAAAVLAPTHNPPPPSSTPIEVANPDDSLVDGPDALFFGEHGEVGGSADADELSADEMLDLNDDEPIETGRSTQINRVRRAEPVKPKPV